MNKLLANFSHCANYYHENAILQSAIATDLANFIPNSKSILELGCGTGQLTKHLIQKSPNIIASDGAGNMVNICQQNIGDDINYLQLDFNNHELLKSVIKEYHSETIVASMCLHWANDFKSTIQILQKSTNQLFISIPLLGSLEDWFKLAQNHGLSIKPKVLFKESYLRNLFPKAKIQIKNYEQNFNSIKEFLEHMYKMGIASNKNEHKISLDIYKKIVRNNQRLTLNYKVAHICWTQ